MSNVVTRIAPSPTGDMHIGTARTALFNWLYARGRNGKFLLRIEDTDKNRSTDAAQDASLDGMKWLGLDFDGEPISQSKRAPRHVEIANKLLETGKAYKCFLTETEIDDLRKLAINNKSPSAFRSPWRNALPSKFPKKPFVIRIKAPENGSTVIKDEVQGDIFISSERVLENAQNYYVSFKDELHRVMIHGILHFAGLKDKSEEEAQLMREAENKALKLLTEMN